MFTQFSAEQSELVSSFIEPGTWVFDCGAGEGWQSEWFADLGAKVVAVDWDPPRPNQFSKRVDVWEMGLYEAIVHLVRDDVWKSRLESATMFLGWPPNASAPEMATLCEMVPRVIYVGNTFDSTMCGDPRLWTHLCRREVLAHVPHRKNSLIVYGLEEDSDVLLAEERAGLDQTSVYSYPY